jgi:hypothetical protein
MLATAGRDGMAQSSLTTLGFGANVIAVLVQRRARDPDAFEGPGRWQHHGGRSYQDQGRGPEGDQAVSPKERSRRELRQANAGHGAAFRAARSLIGLLAHAAMACTRSTSPAAWPASNALINFTAVA